MNCGASVTIRPRMVALAALFFLVNLFLVTTYYRSHASVAATIDHYKARLQGSSAPGGAGTADASLAPSSTLLEELFASNGGPQYEKYSIKYLPNYVSANLNHKHSTLVLSLVSGSAPYGKDRTFDQFFSDVLLSFDNDYSKMSLGLLCITDAEYKYIKAHLKQFFQSNGIDSARKFNKVSIVYAPFLNEGKDSDRNDRQKPWFQKKRRSLIAKSRNFLMNSVMDFENYLLTIDSDIVKVNPKTLQHFIDSGRDIVVPRVKRGDQKDYDLNSWKGTRNTPTQEEFRKIVDAQKQAAKSKNGNEEYIFVPSDKPNEMQHLEDMSKMLRANKKSKTTELVPVDSVGGAVLFLKSEIIKLGVQFPPFYVIGSDWQLPLGGYDGIETEGLCYEANIIGYTCWAMPNLVAEHSVE